MTPPRGPESTNGKAPNDGANTSQPTQERGYVDFIRSGTVSGNASLQSFDRVQEVTKKVGGMRSTVEKAKEAHMLPGEKALDAAGWAVVKKIEEMANGLKGLVASPELRAGAGDALASVLALLRSQPSVTLAPTKELVDSLITVGKANKDNVDPKVQAEVQELRALVIQMQVELAKQSQAVGAMPNIVINNNLGPQAGPQSSAPAALEKKEEQKGWKEAGRDLMYRVSATNVTIRQKQEYRQNRIASESWTSEDQKAYMKEVDSLQSGRKQMLRTVNALVENARKPSGDRNLIAATREETDLEMNQWLLDLQIKGISVRNGAYTIV